MTKSDDSAISMSGSQLPRQRPAGVGALPAGERTKEGAAIEMSFPAEKASLEILRSVIGRASRISGFSYDGIEDFALAVDEAATLLIESHPSDLVLTLTGMHPAERLEVLVSAQGSTKALSLAELRRGYRWDVLQALCEHVWWEDAGTSIGLAQSIR